MNPWLASVLAQLRAAGLGFALVAEVLAHLDQRVRALEPCAQGPGPGAPHLWDLDGICRSCKLRGPTPWPRTGYPRPPVTSNAVAAVRSRDRGGCPRHVLPSLTCSDCGDIVAERVMKRGQAMSPTGGAS